MGLSSGLSLRHVILVPVAPPGAPATAAATATATAAAPGEAGTPATAPRKSGNGTTTTTATPTPTAPTPTACRFGRKRSSSRPATTATTTTPATTTTTTSTTTTAAANCRVAYTGPSLAIAHAAALAAGGTAARVLLSGGCYKQLGGWAADVSRGDAAATVLNVGERGGLGWVWGLEFRAQMKPNQAKLAGYMQSLARQLAGNG